MLHSYDIGKLDISRIYRYLNKYLGIENIEELESSVALKENDGNNHDYQNEEYGE
jgi:hypothetical protein